MKKAQASDVMMILIGSVFAAALLLLVYSVISGIEPPFTGFEVTKEVVQQAYKAQQDICFTRDMVPFNDGEVIVFDSLVPDTVTEKEYASSGFECTAIQCKAKANLQVSVSAKCDFGSGCKLYLGRDDCTST